MSCTILCRTTSRAPRWQNSIPCDAGEDLLHHRKPRSLAGGQVHLRGVAVDDGPRPEAHAGEEHLHLLRGGVLGLVEDDEGVVQRAASHVRERRDLHGPALHEPRERVGARHLEQRVVERLHVRIDLLVERAGEEAQPLAGLDGRAGQDDPRDLSLLQRLHGHGDRQIRLPGAGGADREGDGRLADRVHVALLSEGLGRDALAPPCQQHVAEHVGRLDAVALDEVDGLADRRRRELMAALEQLDQLPNSEPTCSASRRRTGDGDLVAAHQDLASRRRPRRAAGVRRAGREGRPSTGCPARGSSLGCWLSPSASLRGCPRPSRE